MTAPRAYYNEIDPAAAHVLRHLIAIGVIAPGEVDTRSIKDVQADDLKGFTQCHFFAGGGLWSVAARLAGWPDERPIWTGSCPCQGESVAGKRLGAADPRHLWPDFFRLIRAARPAIVLGEQVAAAAGTHWLDGVAADLESENYAARAVDIPACALDAPHIRQRLYWAAVADSEDELGRCRPRVKTNRAFGSDLHGAVALGDGIGARLEGHARDGDRSGRQITAGSVAPADGCDGLHADANGGGCAGRQESEVGHAFERTFVERDLPRINGSFWSDAEWILCHDGKARRAKSDLRLLVDGIPGRVDLWRIGGNAIVPQVAAEVIGALMDVLPEWKAGQ